jgi:peptide/nickel transport system permease protein
MIATLLRRGGFTASLVVAVSFASFLTFGSSIDPTWSMALAQDQTPRHELQTRYHLNDPILEQYGRWVTHLPSDGFGTTVFPLGGSTFAQGSGTAIGPLVWRAAGNTAQLIAVALGLSLLLSVVLGAWTAMRKTPLTALVRLLSLVAWAVPSFVVGVILFYLVPDITRVFPPGPPGGGVVAWLRHMTLPALSLSVALVGLYARYVRAAVLAASHEPYAKVARSKGLSERQIVTRHLLRNSLTPLVSVVALDVGGIVGISLAVDYIFGVQGLAWLFFQGVTKSDPFLLTAVMVLIAIVVAAFVFVADAIVLWLDPRLRR